MMICDWDTVAQSLEARLLTLEDGESFVLDGPLDDENDPDGGSSRYVQFCAYNGGESIRCEVVSNSYLPTHLRHSIDDLVTLRIAGWTLPTALPGEDEESGSYNLFLDVDGDDAAAGAKAVCVALRDLWSMSPYEFVTGGCVINIEPEDFLLREPPNDETARI